MIFVTVGTHEQPFYSHDDMINMIRKARVVVTHRRPCCYMEVLRMGKIPVVVPRNNRLGEQMSNNAAFCEAFADVVNKIL